MLVCTADRPPELWDIGAPQTINQTRLYGDVVRAFFEPGPPEDGEASTWRGLASQAYRDCIGERPGPVHLNLSFRDPLVGTPGPLPELLKASPTAMPVAGQATPSEIAVSHLAASQLLARCLHADGTARRGVIVAGRGQSNPDSILTLATRLGWPILADHQSGCRAPGQSIRHFDALLRDRSFAEGHRPDVIVRFGEIVSSKAISLWIADNKSNVVSAMPWGRRIDPEGTDPLYLPQANLAEAAVTALASPAVPSASSAEWLRSWQVADQAANAAIVTVLQNHEDHNDSPAEPSVAWGCLAGVPTQGALVVSSSMPVRDLEFLAENRNDVPVYANRGANGIDGVTSTAIGIALSGVPTVCLIGDVAFLHDSGALIALARRSLDLTIVVTDNDGGAIFSFLPQQTLLDADRYEQLFGTPHGTDLAMTASSHGLTVQAWDNHIGDGSLVDVGSGVRVVIATTDRALNLALHNSIVEAVAGAL